MSTAISKPLLPTRHLTEIPISDKPPQLGTVIRTITPTEFKERFGCEFTEAILGNARDVNAVLESWRAYARKSGDNLEASKEFTAKVLDRLRNPFTDFVISKISDAVGYGVFATKDIPRNTVISLYSGEMVCYTTYDPYSYRTELGDQDCFISVSSSRCGGIARFLQHLPKNGEKRRLDILSRLLDVDCNLRKQRKKGNNFSREFIAQMLIQKRSDFTQLAKEMAVSEYDSELDDCIFRQSIPQIAVRNVHVKKRIVNGKPLLVLVTLYSIKEGEQLGISYGADYWQGARQFPEFFNVRGNIVPKSLYKRRHVQLSFKSPAAGYIFLSPRLEITPETDLNSINAKIPVSSPYQIRRCLIKANVVGVEKLLPIRQTIFALSLIKVLENQGIPASVQTFFRSNHLNSQDQETFTVDVICKCKGANKHQGQKRLEALLAPIKSHVKSYPDSQEVVFEGTNVIPRAFQDFIQAILRTH